MTEICQPVQYPSNSVILNTVKSIQSIEKFKCEPTNKKLYQSGAWYIGQINGTQRSGWGKFKWSNGGTYEGHYVENKRHGEGKYVWNDKTVYIGMFENDLRHGYGELTWLNKEVFWVFFYIFVYLGKVIILTIINISVFFHRVTMVNFLRTCERGWVSINGLMVDDMREILKIMSSVALEYSQ